MTQPFGHRAAVLLAFREGEDFAALYGRPGRLDCPYAKSLSHHGPALRAAWFRGARRRG